MAHVNVAPAAMAVAPVSDETAVGAVSPGGRPVPSSP